MSSMRGNVTVKIAEFWSRMVESGNSNKALKYIAQEIELLCDGDFHRKNSQAKACISCSKIPNYLEMDRALEPGHIYSQAGIREFEISQLCEYCFDEATLPED